MKMYPTTKEGRYRLLLFPFEAYIVLAFVFGFLIPMVSGGWMQDKELAQQYMLLEYGYATCITALLVGAVTLRDRKTKWSAIGFAALGLIFLILLLPATVVLRTRPAMTEPNQSAEPMGGSRSDQDSTRR
jgi:peptidoglycan/LPS O-acetylase OafA/YrhL